MRFVFLALLVSVLTPRSAPSQVVEWSRRTGTIDRDEAFGVATDSSGIYIAGYTDDILPDLDQIGKQDAFLRKYDAEGNVLWTRQFGSVFDDAALALAADSSGIYVAGSIGPASEEDFTSLNRTDALIQRYDPNGNLLWSRRIDSVGTPQNEAALAVAVGGGAVYLAGYTRGTLPGQNPEGGFDAFLSKYSGDGRELWTRQFGTEQIDWAVGVAAAAGGVYVLGQTDGALPGQSYAGGLYDVFLRKYDSNGVELWTRQFGTSGFEFPGGVAADSSGVYITGATSGALPGQSNASGYDGFVRKYNGNGAELWTRQFSSTGDVLPHGATLHGGDLYVAGDVVGMLPSQMGAGGFNQDVFVKKFSAAAGELWSRQFGTELRDTAAAVAVNSTDIYVAGSVPRVLLSPDTVGDWDGVLTKLTETPLASPVIHPSGVVNAASFTPQAPLSAGSIASVFGLNFSPAGTAGQNPAVVQLNGVTAPIFAVTDTQINFQVPWELEGLSEATLTVSVNGRTSNAVTVPLAATAPGLFSTNASGSGQGAALITGTTTPTVVLAAPEGAFPGSHPVSRGGYVSIYCTGLGAVTNQPPTGVAASLGPLPSSVGPLSFAVAAPTVTVGGVSAAVLFGGLAPSFVGLYQVDIQVPFTAPSGEAVPVELRIGGSTSNTVTIAVQ